MVNVNVELIGPGELASRIGYSTSGVKKLERLGVIPPATRMSGSNHRVWRGDDLPRIVELVQAHRLRSARQPQKSQAV